MKKTSVFQSIICVAAEFMILSVRIVEQARDDCGMQNNYGMLTHSRAYRSTDIENIIVSI